MKTFKHSGAFGDLLYALPIVKHFGGGDFFLHLNQINWIGQHYYGSTPDPFHQGRLRESDFEYMKSFMLAQTYIKNFKILDPQIHEITHNLDRFRPLFVGHPGNYVDIYSSVFRLTLEEANTVRTTPWITVPNPKKVAGRNVIINRTQRWIPATPGNQWAEWKNQGFEDKSFFVGLPQEYEQFTKQIGWNIPYQPTNSMLDVAEYIAGSDQFIGNQSMCLALSIGLGQKFWCELRQDLPRERNECYFPQQPGGNYF